MVKWNEAGGYGFIKPDGGSLPDVFFHIRDCKEARPATGSALEYVPRKQPDGRWRAQSVRTAGRRTAAASRTEAHRSSGMALPAWIALLLLAGFSAIWTWASLQGLVPAIAQIYMLAINLIAFIAYWRDKRAAVRLGQRTPEVLLHGLEVLGGWPGAWLAQRMLRHKSSKQSYQWAYLSMIAINLVALGVWLDAQIRINTPTLRFPLPIT